MIAAPFDLSRVRVLWAPFPGMQTRAVSAREDEVLVGGAKGPGKSDIILANATRQVDKERYKGLILRETGPQLLELIDRSHRLYSKMSSKPAWNGSDRRWTWPSGATVKFEAVGTYAEAERIQGHEWSFIGRDEAGNVPDEKVIDTEIAEIRCSDPTVRTQWMGSANPGKPGHAWIKRRFVTPCGIDGRRILLRRVKLPNGSISEVTRRFIPGTVLDNPIYANDAKYMATLATLPEVLRRQLLYGDWNAGVGQALDELDESKHIVRRFEVPAHWTRFSSFDYGFAHNWVWIYYAVSEDGDVFVVDTVRGRRHQIHDIAERVKSRVPVFHPNHLYTHTDSYSFQRKKERDEHTPTIAELMLADYQMSMVQGNTDRKAGLTNLRYYLAWKGIGPRNTDGLPALRFMDTPGNRWGFEQLQAMVTDEDDMEDVLKVNSNPETGEGGDDFYDSLRVGMASRPPRAIGNFFKGDVHAFSQQTLAYMVEHLYRDTELPAGSGRAFGGDLSTYLTGV